MCVLMIYSLRVKKSRRWVPISRALEAYSQPGIDRRLTGSQRSQKDALRAEINLLDFPIICYRATETRTPFLLPRR